MVGVQECFAGSITIASPSLATPTGTYVYARDALYTRAENASGPLLLTAWGDEYYNGTKVQPVFDWLSLATGQVGGQINFDTWYISDGYDAAIVQYVWDDGIWYASPVQPCAF